MSLFPVYPGQRCLISSDIGSHYRARSSSLSDAFTRDFGGVMSQSKFRYCLARTVLVAALALHRAPAMAQQQARTQSVEVFGGELFGDKLTNAPVSGRNPRLNDDALAGIRYDYNFTDMWGVQLSSGYSWSRASRVPLGDNRLGVTTIDLDAVWNITRQ